jgi:5-formyltetrahydrofolate cyclo-ligase
LRLEKQKIREEVWRILEERGIARFPKPIFGRIPNFRGAEVAARRLASLQELRVTGVVKVNPDSPQRPVRRLLLEAGKVVLMPTPRLRGGFLLLDPKRIPKHLYDKASTIRGAFDLGRAISLDELPQIDFIVCGSVAVTREGRRIGKGGGYSELEYGILRELGSVDEETPIATTVHDLQIVPDLPLDEWDFTVDIIATPSRLLRVAGQRRRPEGIIWEWVSEEMLGKMPILRELRERGG